MHNFTFNNTFDHSLSTLETTQKKFKSLQKKAFFPTPKTMETKMIYHEAPHHTSTPCDQFKNYVTNGTPPLTHNSLEDMITKSLSTDSDGGVLIPSDMSARIMSRLQHLSTIRSFARTVDVSSDRFDVLLQKDQSTVGWSMENGKEDTTKTPELAKITIPVHQLYARPRVTQKLLDDAAINVEEWLMDQIAYQMGKAENQAFLYGDGVHKPKGILNYPKALKGTWKEGRFEKFETFYTETPGALDNETLLMDVLHSLPTDYLTDAAWFMPRSNLAHIRKVLSKSHSELLQPSGEGGLSAYLLLGYPVVLMDDMPALAPDSLSLMFGSLKDTYQVVDRKDLYVLRDPYSAKPYIEFYTTKRVGGDVINFDALKLISFGKSGQKTTI